MIRGTSNQRYCAPASPLVLVSRTLAADDNCNHSKPRQYLLVLGICVIAAMGYMAKVSMSAMDSRSCDDLQRTIVQGDAVTMSRTWGESLAGEENEQNLALHTAVSSSRSDIVQWALALGADPNYAMAFGQSVLHVAAMEANADIAVMLIESGADIDRVNERGVSPLMVAAANGAVDCVYELLAAGADRDIQDHQGRDALVIARANGHEEIVRLLS